MPVYVELPADLLTPVAAYLKVAKDSDHSFLLESIIAGEALARYSFVGADPLKTFRTGEGFDVSGDPLIALEKELEPYRFVRIPQVPTFTGMSIRSGQADHQVVPSVSSRTMLSLILSRSRSQRRRWLCRSKASLKLSSCLPRP